MKEIPLSKGKFALVDDEDYDFLMQWKWCVNSFGYAVRSIGYKKPNGKWSCKTVQMHRVVMNTPDGMDTDHRDTDKLNNQRNNLRICTRAQNKMNTNLRAGGTSGYKGVTWSKQKGKWQGYIILQGEKANLGHFACKVDAAKAYNKAALENFGKFARLNDV